MRALRGWLSLRRPLHAAHALADLLAHAALELEHRLGDDLGPAHVRVPVAQLELRRPAAARPVAETTSAERSTSRISLP